MDVGRDNRKFVVTQNFPHAVDAGLAIGMRTVVGVLLKPMHISEDLKKERII